MMAVPSGYESWSVERKRAFLEPQMLSAHARWQSAVTLGLSCAADCQARYEALRAEYDALGGHDA